LTGLPAESYPFRSMAIDTSKIPALLAELSRKELKEKLKAIEDAKDDLEAAQQALDKAQSALESGLSAELRSLLTPAESSSRMRTAKAEKAQGLQVSANRLKEIFKELGVKEFPIRKKLENGRLDVACVKKTGGG